MAVFHSDLRAGRFLPPFTIGPRSARVLDRLGPGATTFPDDVVVEDVRTPDVLVRFYRPRYLSGPAPALLWLHAGGMIIGNRCQDDTTNIAFARTLGIIVASVEYRLAPEHPAPAALEDAYAALRRLVADPDVDPARVAVGGASAGGGLAAALALLAHDRGDVRPAFQLLLYPMLDDRTVLRTDLDTRHVRVWTPGSNRYGWTSYLGGAAPGDPAVSPYAAPARREDLSGLPPAWIGVGTLDLFYEEDAHYAARLLKAGVPCDFHVVHGAFHYFDALFRRKKVSIDFWRAQARALRAALAGPAGARDG
ncbi:alpha/beta hydrolase [Cryptosporangium arvum]|uniref:alpha/beta hydrolase n=1 Tax=Cryptosporangium arvum TaxID=80871 RepID=UPI0004B86A5A|nr:alpha/beta hydrolase [Cryptosporangium arvum]